MKKSFLKILILISLMLSSKCLAMDNFINADEVELEVEEFISLDGLPAASEPAVSDANGGRLYFNVDESVFKVSLDGAAYEELSTGGGGDFSEGGDSEGANRTLGNQDAFTLGFLTNNATRLSIDAIGNVGIGTESPGALLDVRGSAVFNEEGANADFRIEGDSEQNLFFVDASTDFVGLGTASPGALLDVRGSAVFNEDGADADFRIEGDSDQDLFFVDASTDFVGLSTNSPSALLHGDGGAFVFTGATGTTPVSGTGTRMMWVPAKAAFRAGQVVSTQWDDGNVGTGSMVLGRFSEATALNSVAIGPNNTSSNTASIAIGSSATASALSATALGKDVTASGTSSVAIGEFVTAGSASNAIAIGRGADASNNLINNVTNTFMVGMNSNLPTLTVSPSSGVGTTGNVGIATSSPSNKFDIQASGEIVELGDGSASDIVINFDEGADRNFGWDDSENSISTFDEQLRFRTRQGSSPPVACTSAVTGMNWFDIDTGLLYLCDTSNSRNKWLSPQEAVIYGEEDDVCPSGSNIGNEEDCSVDFGDQLGTNGNFEEGFYIPRDITKLVMVFLMMVMVLVVEVLMWKFGVVVVLLLMILLLFKQQLLQV